MSVQLTRFLGNIFTNGTLSEWNASTLVPEDKKVIITQEGHEKIGDGIHLFKDLPFIYHSSMYQTVIAHTANLSTLNTTVGSHTTTLSDHATRIGKAEASITSLNTTVSSHTTTLATHTTQINKAITDITSLNTTVSSHTTTLSTHTSQIATLNTNLTSHTSNVSNPHKVTAEQVGSPTTTQFNTLNATVTAQGTSIANLETTADVLRNVPVVAVPGNITLIDNHRGKCLRMAAVSTVNIPTDTSAPLLVPGTTITVLNRSAGVVTIAPASEITLGWIGENVFGRRTIGPLGMATLYKDAANAWIISGNGVE